MTIDKLDVVLDLQDKMSGGLGAAAKNVSGFNDQVESSMTKAHGATSKLGGALGGITKIAGGVALGGGLMQAPSFLMNAAKAAAEDEKETARLAQTIRSLGGDFDSQMGKVNDAIAAGQKLAFSDSEVRDSFQFLAQATGSTEEALTKSKAAMDLARGANIPLSAATKMLGKMNEENVEVFKKLGIVMGEGATEAEALAAVQAKFGGQADAYAKSTAGQFEVMKIKIGEAKETLGAALLPIMLAVGTILANYVVPAIEAFVAAVGPNLQTAGAIAKTVFDFIKENFDYFGPVIAAVAAVILLSLVPAMIAWTVSTWAQVTALLAQAVAFALANAPLILIIAGVALLTAGIVWLIKHWEDITAKVPWLTTALQAVTDFIKDPVIPILTSIWEKGLKPVIDFVVDHWQLLATIIAAPFMVIYLLATDAFGIRTALVDAFQWVLDFVTNNWQLIGAIISGPFFLIVALATDLFGIRSAIVGAVEALWTKISGWGGDVLTFFQDLPRKLSNGFGAGFDFLWQAFKGSINSIIRAWNGLEFGIPGFDPPGPGPSIPGITISTPNIPELRRGTSFVPQDMLAFIHKGEAIIPAAQNPWGVRPREREAPPSTISITVAMPNYLGSRQEVARQILLELRRAGVSI